MVFKRGKTRTLLNNKQIKLGSIIMPPFPLHPFNNLLNQKPTFCKPLQLSKVVINIQIQEYNLLVPIVFLRFISNYIYTQTQSHNPQNQKTLFELAKIETHKSVL